MKALLQRVESASVVEVGADGGRLPLGDIGPGLLVLLGVVATDTPATVVALARKVAALRIFADAAGKTNLSVKEVGGGILLVSQFTLCADTRRGNRPSFVGAAAPALAEALYVQMRNALALELGQLVPTGRFGADMRVALVNDGPFTVMLDTDAA